MAKNTVVVDAVIIRNGKMSEQELIKKLEKIGYKVVYENGAPVLYLDGRKVTPTWVAVEVTKEDKEPDISVNMEPEDVEEAMMNILKDFKNKQGR